MSVGYEGDDLGEFLARQHLGYYRANGAWQREGLYSSQLRAIGMSGQALFQHRQMYALGMRQGDTMMQQQLRAQQLQARAGQVIYYDKGDKPPLLPNPLSNSAALAYDEARRSVMRDMYLGDFNDADLSAMFGGPEDNGVPVWIPAALLAAPFYLLFGIYAVARFVVRRMWLYDYYYLSERPQP